MSHPLFQLHNEDDSSEASTSEQQPCTSATAQAGTSSSQGQSQAGQASAAAATAAAGEASGSRTQGDAEAPPPPYASIELGATAAAPGMCNRSLSHLSNSSFFLSSTFIFPQCGFMLPKIAKAAKLWRFLAVVCLTLESVLISMTALPHYWQLLSYILYAVPFFLLL